MEGSQMNPATSGPVEITLDMAKQSLQEAKELLVEAKSAGLDVTDVENVYLNAKPALQNKDFATAYQIGEQVKVMIAQKIDSLSGGEAPPSEEPPAAEPPRKVVKKVVKKAAAPQESGGIDKGTAIEALKEAKTAIARAKQAGYDISSAAEKFKEAKPHLDAGDFHSAYLVAQEVMSILSALQTAAQSDEYRAAAEEAVVTLQGRLDELARSGQDISQYSAALENAVSALDAGDYQSAYTVATEAINTLPQPEVAAEEPSQPPYQPQPEQAQMTGDVNALQARMNEMQEYLIGLQNQGYDITSYWQVFEAATNAFNAGDIAGATAKLDELDAMFQPPEQAEAPAEQPATYTAEDAKAKIKEARDRIMQVKAAGMDISDLQSIFMEAKPALSSGDYATAYSIGEQIVMMADQMLGVGGAPTGGAEVFQEARELIDFLKGYSVPVQDYEADLNDAEGAYNSGDSTALDRAKAIVDQLRARKTEVSSQMAEEEINKARAAAQECVEKGFDIESVTADILRAEQAMQTGDFNTALEAARKARLTAENMEKYNEAVAAVQSAKASIQYLQNLDVDVSEAKEILKEAKRLMDSGDFDGVIEVARRTEDKVEEIKQNAIVSIVNSMVIELRKDVAFLKEEGADTAEIEGYLKAAEDLAAENRYDDAKKSAQQAREIADGILEQYLGKRAMNSIIQIQADIASAKDENIDTKEAEAIFEEARKAYEAKDFRNALDTVKQVENILMNARKKRELVSVLKEARDKIAEARAAGAEVSHAEDLFNSAKPAVKEGDYDRAMELGLKARKEAEEALLQHEVFQLVEYIQKKIKEAQALGIPTTELEEDYNRTRTALEESDFDGAYSIAKQTQMAIDELLDTHKESVDSVTKVEAELSDLKAMGIRSPMAESLLEEAKNALSQLDYEKVKSAIEQSSNHLAEAKKRYEEAFEAIQKAQTKIGEAKKMGASTRQAEAIFASVPQALDDANYEEAAEYARQAEEAAILSKQRYERAFDVVSMAQKKISEAKKIGADVSIAENIMKQIPVALDDGDYDKVMELARKAEKEAEEAKKLTEQLVDLLKMTKEKIETYRKKGADVRDAERLFQQMIAAIDRTDLEEAMQIGESALESVERARLIHEQLVEEIKNAQKKISEAKQLGVDVSKAMAVFNQIPIARNAGDFAKAIALAKEARTKVEDSLKRYNALNLIQETYQKVNDAKRIGSDVSVSEELLSQARAALKLEDYDGAIKLAKQSAAELAARLLGESAAAMGNE